MNAHLEAAPGLTLAEIRAARALLGDRILKTPVQPLFGPAVEAAFAPGTKPVLKLELFQRTGSFKARGALLNMLALGEAERRRGICAISAGNHAIAAAFAARSVGTSRTLMPTSPSWLAITSAMSRSFKNAPLVMLNVASMPLE